MITMKTKCLDFTWNFKLLAVFICSLLIFLSACEKENENELIGTWQCIGFGNTQTQFIRLIEPQYKGYYELTFANDSMCGAWTTLNSVNWYYQIQKDSIVFTSSHETQVLEKYDDVYIFKDAINNAYAYEIFAQERLKIFYKGNEYNYLLFYKVDEITNHFEN